jgi:co-chaperonin GroES (HSP10)
MLNPVGYYVLVRVEKVEQVSAGGIVIASNTENKREQEGHDVGVVESFGPTCFTGFRGVNDEDSTEDRCKSIGVGVGDKVEFSRYDGKVPRDPEFKDYRLIQDQHIIGVYR